MREAAIESYVRENTTGRLIKFVSPGESGVPDRIHLLPGRIVFIEFKKPGGVLSERQKLWIERLTGLGHEVRVINSMEEARRYVDEIRAETLPTAND